MKVLVARPDLVDAVVAVSTVVPTRSTQPVLANVLLTAEDSRLTITGTDKEQSLFISIPADVSMPGSIAVPAKKLNDVLRQIKDGEVELDIEEFKLKILNQGQWVKLPGMSPDDFPQAEILREPQNSFTIESNVLLNLMDLTAYAMSTEITRINLSGVLWQIFPEEMRMVATDGHLLALVKMPMKTGFSEPFEMLLPERAATRLQSIIAKSGVETVEITPGDGSVQFVAGRYRFQSRLITEKFPDYERVLPFDNDMIMIADREELIEKVQLMDVVTSQITHLVRFNLEQNNLELSAQDMDTGSEGRAPMSVEYSAEPLHIGFNAKMLLNLLKHIPADRVRFAMRGPSAAALITPVPQPEQFEYITVLMPLRIPGEE